MLLSLLVGCNKPATSPAVPSEEPQSPLPSASSATEPPKQAVTATAPEPPREDESQKRAALDQYRQGLGLIESKPAEAITALQKAVELDPSLAEAWNDLAYALVRRAASAGRVRMVAGPRGDAFTGAMQAAEKALALKPGWPYAQYNLGVALLADAQYADAVEPLRRSMEQQPDRAEPAAALGLAYVGIGEEEKAIQVCRKAKELDPNSQTAADCLGLAGDGLVRLPDSEAALGQRRYEKAKGFSTLAMASEFVRISPPRTCATRYADGFMVTYVGCRGDGPIDAWGAQRAEAGKTPSGIGVGSTRAEVLAAYGGTHRNPNMYRYRVSDLHMSVHFGSDDRVSAIWFSPVQPGWAVEKLAQGRVRAEE